MVTKRSLGNEVWLAELASDDRLEESDYMNAHMESSAKAPHAESLEG